MPGTNLTRDEARQRAQVIRVDAYAVSLDLTCGPETFRTVTTVTFAAPAAGRDDGADAEETFIDLVVPSVRSIELNGEQLDPAEHYAGSRIRLPRLRAHNTLTVDATGAYLNTGEGLHRFVDPADGEVYLYTQFQVPDARRVFAVFEQPDLKATYQFTVTAPAHWQVVSNQPTPQPGPAPDAANVDGAKVARWEFDPTPPLSSYVTALVAGPYDVVRDEVRTRAGTVPLGVFCRRSLRRYLDAEEILGCTKAGFAFFEEEFDQAYPFAKYDQLFTPEYNMGAMENAGCVTIAETYVFRGKVTEAMVERRALTILHELAHMWFGDLVTMRWWDDLWLNESFAEWASTTCQAEVTRWSGAWATFATSEKAWAYRQDQLSSTHPVAADMHDLSAVEVNFDGITYAKGASVLKQLVAYVGREPFRDGLRAYFTRHAWGSTTLGDLLAELEATSGRDLGSWSKVWLETAGVNTLRPVLQVAEGVIEQAAIEQTAPPEHPVLRPHRLAVGCYQLRGEQLVRVERIELDVDAERTPVPQLVGMTVPDLLLVNDDDLAYAKIRLDDHSLATALSRPGALAEPLPRALVLGAAWDMTRDAQMAASDYVRLVIGALPGETDSNLLRVLLQQMSAAALTYTAVDRRQEVLDDLTAGLRAAAEGAAPGGDAQLQLVTAWATFARSEEDLRALSGMLCGDRVLEGLDVDQDMRWTLVTALAAGGAVGEAEIAAEQARDNTATGREQAARARAARPVAQAKQRAWEEAVVATGQPNAVVAALAHGFGRVHDPRLLEPYVARFHAEVEQMWASRTHAIAEAVARGFYPLALADENLLEATQDWLDRHLEAPSGLRRVMAENRDGVARAVAAQRADR